MSRVSGGVAIKFQNTTTLVIVKTISGLDLSLVVASGQCNVYILECPVRPPCDLSYW